MEGGAEHLEVPEDPAADLVEHVLADPSRAQQELLARDRLHQRAPEHRADDGEQRRGVAARWIGGMPESMPTLTR